MKNKKKTTIIIVATGIILVITGFIGYQGQKVRNPMQACLQEDF